MRNKKTVRIMVCMLLLGLTMVAGGCQTELQQEAPEEIVDSMQGVPEFVDDLAECTDTLKQYVLPDGNLYEYRSVFISNAVNQLAHASNENGSVFNKTGFQNGVRLRSILEIGEFENCFLTGYMKIRSGDVIYLNGSWFHPEHEFANVLYTAFYDENGVSVASVSMQNARDAFEILETHEDGSVAAMKVKTDDVPQEAVYVRMTLIGAGEGCLISVNEPLDVGYEEYQWVVVGPYVSPEWFEEIRITEKKIHNLDIADRSEVISFMFVTDIHLDPYSVDAYTERLGRISAEVMRECDIPYFVTGGDNSTQSAGFMPSDFTVNMENLLRQLEPVPQRNIMLSLGNHDGATGWYEPDGEGGYYRYQLNNQQRSEVFFDWQRETNEHKCFDSDGTYYYMDDPNTQVRWIILNSFWSQWEGEADGLVTDVEHSFFHSGRFGKQQLEWLAQEALQLPAGYDAVLVAHYAPDAADFEVFKGIVDAYNGKNRYAGSYTGKQPWQNVEMDVDYKKSKGEIIALFQGHRHKDFIGDSFENVVSINMTTTGAVWAVRDENLVERIKNTATECAIDAVVIDKTARRIYMIRLGAGEDRIVEY